jgi:membrane protein YqaA with SNARE-associated domain
LPVLGSVLSVTLGYMRANPYTTLMSISVGKAVRYAIIIISIYYINN